MSILQDLETRCESKCELCNDNSTLEAYTISPKTGNSVDEQVAVCQKCKSGIEDADATDVTHWRCLAESMWSPVPAVQVISYRLLNRLNSLPWAADLKSQMYMEESTLEWAEYGETAVVHKDSNGQVLENGDAVVLIQDLNVKGAGFTAKRGTAVKRIRLVPDNEEHIEGRVEGQQIVILTKYVKKS